MVIYCVAYGCKNGQDTIQEIPFHRFPFKRPEILTLWIKAIRREAWTPSKTSRLCGAHFLPSDYVDKPGSSVKILKLDAVPSVFSFPKHLQNKPILPHRKLLKQDEKNEIETELMDITVLPSLAGPNRSPPGVRDDGMTVSEQSLSTEDLRIPEDTEEENKFIGVGNIQVESSAISERSLSIEDFHVPQDSEEEMLPRVGNIQAKNGAILNKEFRCRTCFTLTANHLDLVPLISTVNGQASVRNLLMEIVPDLVEEYEDNDKICKTCLDVIIQTMKFKVSCIASNELWKQVNGTKATEQAEPEDGVESDPLLHMSDSVPENKCNEIDSGAAVESRDENEDTIEEIISILGETDEGDLLKQRVAERPEYCCIDDTTFAHTCVVKLRQQLTQIEDGLEDLKDADTVIAVNDLQGDVLCKLAIDLASKGVNIVSDDKPFDIIYGKKKRRMILLGDRTLYKCPKCTVTFKLQDDFNLHVNKEHGLINNYFMEPRKQLFKFYKTYSNCTCHVCNKAFETVRALKHHLRKCVSFSCPYCDKLLPAVMLRSHTEQEHNDPKPFRCLSCEESFASYSFLKRHACGSGKPFRYIRKSDTKKCGLCGKRVMATQFKDHFQVHKTHLCDECPKAFSSTSLLNRHKQTHMRQSSTLCPICGKTLASANSLRLHIVSHEEEEVKCEHCHKTFSNRHRLKFHIQKIHNESKRTIICDKCGQLVRAHAIGAHMSLKHRAGVYKFVCPICGERFCRRDYHKRHINRHGTSTFSRQKKDLNAKFYVCRYCGRKCTDKQRLKLHIKTHLNIFRYKCRYCTMSYTSQNNMKRHEKSHEDEGDQVFHKCDTCWKKFETSEELEKHSTMHVRKYACEVCGERFGRVFSLNSHLLREHSESNMSQQKRLALVKEAVLEVGEMDEATASFSTLQTDTKMTNEKRTIWMNVHSRRSRQRVGIEEGEIFPSEIIEEGEIEQKDIKGKALPDQKIKNDYKKEEDDYDVISGNHMNDGELFADTKHNVKHSYNPLFDDEDEAGLTDLEEEVSKKYITDSSDDAIKLDENSRYTLVTDEDGNEYLQYLMDEDEDEVTELKSEHDSDA